MKKLLLFITACTFFLNSNAQTPSQKVFSTSGDIEANHIFKTSSNHIIVVGSTAIGSNKMLVMKLDSAGNRIWEKAFGSSFNFEGFGGTESKDGSYLIIGVRRGSRGASDRARFLKLDSSGKILITKEYAGGLGSSSTGEAGYSIIEQHDKSIVFVGEAQRLTSNAIGRRHFYLAKLDSLGNLIWSKKFGKNGFDAGTDVIQGHDSSIIVVGQGWGSRFGIENNNCVINKFSQSGGLVWGKAIGSDEGDYGFSVAKTSDGNYVVAGFNGDNNIGGTDAYLVKFDGSGNILWSQVYGGSNTDIAYDVVETADSGFAIAGTTENFSTGEEDVFLLKTDSKGVLQWAKTYGDTLEDGASKVSLMLTDNSHFVIATSSKSFSNSETMYLITTDSVGESGSCRQQTANFQSKSITSKEGNGPSIRTEGDDFNINIGTFSPTINSINIDFEINTGIIDTITCFGDTTGVVFASANSPGFTFKWSNNTLGDTIYNAGGGYNYVYARYLSGCEIKDSVFLGTKKRIDVAPTITPPTCIDALNGKVELNINGNKPPYSFLWSTGDTISVIDSLPKGMYWVRVKDSLNCEALDSFQLNPTDTIPIKITRNSNYSGFDLRCFGDSSGSLLVTPSSVSINTLLQWSNGQTDSVASNLTAGNYKVTATSSLGCISVDSITITSPTALSTAIDITTKGACKNEVLLTVSGGVTKYSYKWDSAANFDTTNQLIDICPGDYCVAITDANNCKIDTCINIIKTNVNSIEGAAIKVYPVPASNEVFISLPKETNLQEVAVFTLNGKKIEVLAATNIGNTVRLDVSSLSSGIYTLELVGKNKRYYKRLVIK